MKKIYGFTLIELLIVVAIIAILAAIAVPNFLEAQVRSKVSRTRSDLRTIATGLESYAVDNNHYPPMLGPVGSIYVGEPSQTAYGIDRGFEWRTLPPMLSTPVAYLSTQFIDVFKIGGVGSQAPHLGNPYDSGNAFDIGYTYHNIVDYVRAGWGPENIDYYGSWRIFSLGPDKAYNTPFGDADASLGWIYDPTNGTISRGCVLRTARSSELKAITYNP